MNVQMSRGTCSYCGCPKKNLAVRSESFTLRMGMQLRQISATCLVGVPTTGRDELPVETLWHTLEYMSSQRPGRFIPPHWDVSCKKCARAFTHSPIGKARKLQDYVAPTEPAFPVRGAELECPHCGANNIYFLTDLRYVPARIIRHS